MLPITVAAVRLRPARAKAQRAIKRHKPMRMTSPEQQILRNQLAIMTALLCDVLPKIADQKHTGSESLLRAGSERLLEDGINKTHTALHAAKLWRDVV